MRHLRAALCMLMAIWSLPATAGQFSIACVRGGERYFITFDEETKRVILENPIGSAYRGRVDSLSESKVQFYLLRVGEPRLEFEWDRGAGSIARIGVPKESPQAEFSTHCVASALRPILSIYDRVAPYE